MTTNKITLQTITVLPIEVGEEGFDKINRCIEAGASKEERYEYFPDGSYNLGHEELDERVVRVGRLKESEIKTEEETEVYTDIYSTKVEDYSNGKNSSICLLREKIVKIEEIDALESLELNEKLDTIRTREAILRAALDEFLHEWKDIQNAEKRMGPDEAFDSYEGALYDIGFQEREEWLQEKELQFGPAFHYTFYVISCSKKYESVAKTLAYNLNSSILALAPDELLTLDSTELDEAFTEKIDSPLELYLLANRSAFVILCVDVDEGNEISKVAKLAAIRAQSVRNSCYFYTEGTNEKLDYLNGQRLLSLSEAVLTRPISSTRETLSDRILEKLIEPSGIPPYLKSFRDLVASKKVKEEKEKEDKEDRARSRLQSASAIQSIILGIIGVIITFFPSGISLKTLGLVALFVVLPVVILTLTTIVLVPPWRKKVRGLLKRDGEDTKAASTKSGANG